MAKSKKNLIKINDITDYEKFFLFLKQNEKKGEFFIYNQKNPYIKVEWITGGVSGGSCWGGETYSFVNDDWDDQLIGLDNILWLVCPNISYLQYKKLENTIIKEESRSANDYYYGNYTNYRSKCVFIRELYNELVKFGLICV